MVPKNTNYLNELKNQHYQLKRHPIAVSFADAIAEQMIDFYEDDKRAAIRLSQFLRYKQMPAETFYNLKERSTKLQTAHKWALMVMAERREIAMLEKRYDSGGSRDILPRYCNEWRAQMLNEAKLKAIAAIYAAKATAGTFNASDLEIIDHMYDDLEKEDVGNDPGALEQVQTKTLPESTD